MTKFDPIIILLMGSLPLLIFSLIGLIRSLFAKNREIDRLNSKSAGVLNKESSSENLSGGADKAKAGSVDWAEQLTAKDAEIKRLNAQSSGMLAKQDHFEKKIAQYKKMESDIGRIERESEEYKQKAENLRAELAKAKAGFTDGESQLSGKDAEIKRLADQLVAEDAGLKRLTDQLKAKDADIDNLADQLAANYIEIKQLNEKLADMRAPRKLPGELAAKLGGVKTKSAGGSKLIAVESAEMELLADQLAAKDSEIEHHKQAIENLHWELDKLCTSSAKAADQLTAKDAEIKRLLQRLLQKS